MSRLLMPGVLAQQQAGSDFALVSSAYQEYINTQTWTLSFDNPSEGDLLLILVHQISGSTDGKTINSLTYGGVAAEFIDSIATVAHTTTYIYGIRAANLPSAGAHDLTLVWNAASFGVLGVATLSGVHPSVQSGALSNLQSVVGEGLFNTPRITEITPASQPVVLFDAFTARIGSADLEASFSQEELYATTIGSGGRVAGASYKELTSTDPAEMGWFDAVGSFSRNTHLVIAIPVNAATPRELIPITNVFENGNFADSSWWAGNRSTLTVEGGGIMGVQPTEVQPVNASRHHLSSGAVIDVVSGTHRWFFAADVYGSSTVKFWSANQGRWDKTTSDTWERMAIRPYETENSYWGWSDNDPGLLPFKVSYAVAIDLTATFGAGNEPTVMQMEDILASFPNKFFDGTEQI